MHVGGDEAGDVRHVGDDRRPDGLADRADPRELDHARVGARPDHDHLRLVLVRQPLELLVVDPLVVFADAVGDDGVELAGEVQRMAVREVAAVREVHARGPCRPASAARSTRPCWPARRSAAARWRAPRRTAASRARSPATRPRRRTRTRRSSASRVAFGVLVGHHRPGRLQHRLADEILRRDELEARVLPVLLVPDRVGDLRVRRGERAPAGRGLGRCHAMSLVQCP